MVNTLQSIRWIHDLKHLDRQTSYFALKLQFENTESEKTEQDV